MTEEERYRNLVNERQAALDNSNQTYNDLLSQNTAYSTGYNDYLNNYQNTQNEIYDKQTAYNVGLQEQNKQRAEQEYQKEAMASKNAYYDFINPYGVQAEIQAQNGLNRSGYGETVKSQAWTTQQNRTAQAKANLNNAKLQFDNAIKEAYMNNDIQKAQLALQLLQQQQQEALRSFNYASDIRLNQLGTNQNLDSEYNNRYNTLYNQIQNEKDRQEAIRQWEAEMQFKQNQARQEQSNWEREYALKNGGGYPTGYDDTGVLTDDSLQDNSINPLASIGAVGYTSTNQTTNTTNNANKVKNPYTNTVNPDTKYGTFSNGYQPNNVGGSKLSKSGYTVKDVFGTGNVGSTGVNIDNQKIWKTSNGKYYIWDGSQDKYVDITNELTSTKTNKTLAGGGGFR